MIGETSDSFFAPAGRAGEQVLQHESLVAANSQVITTLLDAVPDFLMVLNAHRQIVVVNKRLLSAFGVEQPESLLGLRPGEAVGCVHVKDGPDGCGTAGNCSVCVRAFGRSTRSPAPNPSFRAASNMTERLSPLRSRQKQ